MWRQRACHPGRVQVDWHLLDASVVVDGYFDGPLNDPPDIRFVSAAGGERHSVACDSEGRVWIAGVGDGAGDPRMLYQNDDDDPTDAQIALYMFARARSVLLVVMSASRAEWFISTKVSMPS